MLDFVLSRISPACPRLWSNFYVIRKMVHSLKTEGLRLVQNFYTIVVYSL